MLPLLVLMAAQTTPLGPVIPQGANRSFLESAMMVQQLLAQSKFVEARKAANALPRPEVRYRIDLADVPKARQADVTNAVERAIADWTKSIPELKFTPATDGTIHLRFAFSEKLPDGELNIPQGSVIMTSTSPEDPRIDATIGLNRSNPAIPALSAEIQNEASFAIASYFGFERTYNNGLVTFRSDMPGMTAQKVSGREISGTRRLLSVVDRLRSLATAETVVIPARPQIFIEAKELDVPGVKQGEFAAFALQVTNNGNAPLALRAESECACYVAEGPRQIEAGRTELIRAMVNTRDFTGKLEKRIRFFSNDPDFPLKEVMVRTVVTPAYRLIDPGPEVIELTDEGAKGEMILLLDENTKWKPTSVRVDGFKNTVAMEPWEGEIADPEHNEPARKGKGYRFKVNFENSTLEGRSPATLVILTDAEDDLFKVIRRNFELQRGIVASPPSVYFGDIPNKPTTAFLYLSSAGKPFKITKIESDKPYITAEARLFRGDRQYRLEVTFKGEAVPGFLNGTLTVHTDDPSRPTIQIPIQGTVQ